MNPTARVGALSKNEIPKLLKLVLDREPNAARQFVEMISPIIHARVGRVLRRRNVAQCHDVQQEAMDLTQQTYANLLKNNGHLLRSWDPERGMSLANYVGMIAEQTAEAATRKRSEEVWRSNVEITGSSDLVIDSSRTPERLAAAQEILAAISSRVCAQLNKRGQRLLRAVCVEGRPVREVSALMNISESAINAWQHRLLNRTQQITREVLSDA